MMQENHLAKWLNNELSEAELTEFKNSEDYASYQRIINVSNTLESPDFDIEHAFEAVKNKRILEQSNVVKLNPFKKFLRVAAVILVLLTCTYFYTSTLDLTFNTKYAESKTIELPDASQVILNAESLLSFNENNWDNNRNISLKGEAFFKVAKGKRFTVTTTDGLVTVLGTQFNVKNRQNYFEVTCYEGLVSVLFNNKETKLPAGSSFKVINNTIISSEATKKNTPSWTDTESSFKSVPLKYVLNEFQRQHNIIVEIKNIDTNQLYTGTFSNTDSNLALQSISMPSQIKFKLEGNKVLFYAEN